MSVRGIYGITNKLNNKIYIGESLDILRRWNEHIESLNNNKHHSYKLQQDWNKYGQDNFEFKILSVLDSDINNFIDEYILISYENINIKKYNSIEAGYNIENTFEKVLKNEKCLFNEKKDNKVLQIYNDKISNEEIKDIGGIIYQTIYGIDKIKNELKINTNDGLKGLMYNNNLLIYKGRKSYILNNEIINEEHICRNDTFAKIKVTYEGFIKICNILKESIDSGKAIYKIPSVKEDTTIKHDINTDENNSDNILSINDFLLKYKLNSNINRNGVFKFLRESNILEYVEINGKRYNLPTEKYKEYFVCKKYKSKNDYTYVKTFVNELGFKYLHNFLKKIPSLLTKYIILG